MKLFGLIKKKSKEGVIFASEEDRDSALTNEEKFIESLNCWGMSSLASTYFEDYVYYSEAPEDEFHKFEIELEGLK